MKITLQLALFLAIVYVSHGLVLERYSANYNHATGIVTCKSYSFHEVGAGFLKPKYLVYNNNNIPVGGPTGHTVSVDNKTLTFPLPPGPNTSTKNGWIKHRYEYGLNGFCNCIKGLDQSQYYMTIKPIITSITNPSPAGSTITITGIYLHTTDGENKPIKYRMENSDGPMYFWCTNFRAPAGIVDGSKLLCDANPGTFTGLPIQTRFISSGSPSQFVPVTYASI